jgi:hypothetical protein
MMIKNERELVEAIAEMREAEAYAIAKAMLDRGEDPVRVLELCREAIDIAGKRFETLGYFLPELKGIHTSGGLSNIAQQLPPKAADGSDLKQQLECAFLTLARLLGMDTVLATPWHEFQILPEDNYVLGRARRV